MDLPIADGPVVYICFPIVQGHCKKCLHFITTRPKEVHPTRSTTWRLMRMISAWAAQTPATQIAAIYEISDTTVRRGHNYVTIVLNGDTGELLYMAEGKKREVLDRFLSNSLSKKRAELRHTCREQRSSMTVSI